MWYTHIYSNIMVYQKYILGASIKVGCTARNFIIASSGPKAEGVPNNNQMLAYSLSGAL